MLHCSNSSVINILSPKPINTWTGWDHEKLLHIWIEIVFHSHGAAGQDLLHSLDKKSVRAVYISIAAGVSDIMKINGLIFLCIRRDASIWIVSIKRRTYLPATLNPQDIMR